MCACAQELLEARKFFEKQGEGAPTLTQGPAGRMELADFGALVRRAHGPPRPGRPPGGCPLTGQVPTPAPDHGAAGSREKCHVPSGAGSSFPDPAAGSVSHERQRVLPGPGRTPEPQRRADITLLIANYGSDFEMISNF